MKFARIAQCLLPVAFAATLPSMAQAETAVFWGANYVSVSSSVCGNGQKALYYNNRYWCVQGTEPVSSGGSSSSGGSGSSGSGSSSGSSGSGSSSSSGGSSVVTAVYWGQTYAKASASVCSDGAKALYYNNGYWCPYSGSTAGSGSGSSGSVATTYSANLNWSAPSTREDGTPLALSELKGYEIYYTSEDLNVSQTVSVSGASTASHKVSNLKAGTYYFAISAIDIKGAKSSLSPMVSAKFGN